MSGLLTLGHGTVFLQMKKDFEAAGYTVVHRLLNASDYGVPQTRERVFIIGVRQDIPFHYEFPSALPAPTPTLRDTIGDLEREPGDYYEGSFSSMYLSRNRKKRWDQPSFTIQASARHAPLHPSGAAMVKVDKDHWQLRGDINRRLSVREIARIQTFPDWFEFSSGSETKTAKAQRLNKIYKQIGNAVPVRLALAVFEPIARFFHQSLLESEDSGMMVSFCTENAKKEDYSYYAK